MSTPEPRETLTEEELAEVRRADEEFRRTFPYDESWAPTSEGHRYRLLATLDAERRQSVPVPALAPCHCGEPWTDHVVHYPTNRDEAAAAPTRPPEPFYCERSLTCPHRVPHRHIGNDVVPLPAPVAPESVGE